MDPNTVARSSSNWQLIPAELRALPQWTLAGPDKAPLTINGGHASVTNPSTWASFDDVCRAAKPGQFIGYVISKDDPFACIDLDWIDAESQARKGKPIDPSLWSTDATTERYQRILDLYGSYTEISANGKGLHVWVRGDIGPGW